MANVFVDEKVPDILKLIDGGYIIKGGRVHMIYFRGIYSRDWDIVGTPTSIAKIKDHILSESQQCDLIIDVEFREIHNSYHLTIMGEPEPFMDLIIESNITLDSFNVGGVPYTTLSDYVDDLYDTLGDRYNKFFNYRATIAGNFDNISGILKEKLEIDYNLPHDQESNTSVGIISNKVMNMLINKSTIFDEKDTVIGVYIGNILNIINYQKGTETLFVEYIRKIFIKQLTHSDYQKWSTNHFPMLVTYGQLIYSIRISEEFQRKYLIYQSKYSKSSERLSVVKNVTWDSMTNIFQEAISCCDHTPYLFTIEGVHYYFRNYDKSILVNQY